LVDYFLLSDQNRNFFFHDERDILDDLDGFLFNHDNMFQNFDWNVLLYFNSFDERNLMNLSFDFGLRNNHWNIYELLYFLYNCFCFNDDFGYNNLNNLNFFHYFHHLLDDLNFLRRSFNDLFNCNDLLNYLRNSNDLLLNVNNWHYFFNNFLYNVYSSLNVWYYFWNFLILNNLHDFL